jgi:hypothetical protein
MRYPRVIHLGGGGEKYKGKRGKGLKVGTNISEEGRSGFITESLLDTSQE